MTCKALMHLDGCHFFDALLAGNLLLLERAVAALHTPDSAGEPE